MSDGYRALEAAVIDALAAAGAFRRVEGITALAELAEKQGAALPAAFVAVERDSAGAPLSGAGLFRQQMTADILVLIVAGTHRSAAQQSQGLSEARAAVMDALFAAQFPGLIERPLAYAGGSLVDISGGRILWAMRFRADFYLSGRPA
jgi:hypothetical protein